MHWMENVTQKLHERKKKGNFLFWFSSKSRNYIRLRFAFFTSRQSETEKIKRICAIINYAIAIKCDVSPWAWVREKRKRLMFEGNMEEGTKKTICINNCNVPPCWCLLLLLLLRRFCWSNYLYSSNQFK